MSYTELQVTTNFSFLRGGSHPEEFVEQAAAYGYTAIAITDSTTVFPAGTGAPASLRERATWVLSRSDGRWLIEAYHGCPEDAA